MLQMLRDFLSEVGAGDKPAARLDENDCRLAAAALLIHIMAVDGHVSAREQETLRAVLKKEFSLDDEAADELIEAGTAADREAVDLYSFTSVIKRSLDEEARGRIVEMMWKIVYSDGAMNEFEDNIVWRASDLLGISSRERVELRRSVAAEKQSRGDA
jgi:uncharacterized tellurite resistance protein B-like protein